MRTPGHAHERTRGQKRHISGGCLFWDLIYFASGHLSNGVFKLHIQPEPQHTNAGIKKNKKKTKQKKKQDNLYFCRCFCHTAMGREEKDFLFVTQRDDNKLTPESWILNVMKIPSESPFLKWISHIMHLILLQKVSTQLSDIECWSCPCSDIHGDDFGGTPPSRKWQVRPLCS